MVLFGSRTPLELALACLGAHALRVACKTYVTMMYSTTVIGGAAVASNFWASTAFVVPSASPFVGPRTDVHCEVSTRTVGNRNSACGPMMALKGLARKVWRQGASVVLTSLLAPLGAFLCCAALALCWLDGTRAGVTFLCASSSRSGTCAYKVEVCFPSQCSIPEMARWSPGNRCRRETSCHVHGLARAMLAIRRTCRFVLPSCIVHGCMTSWSVHFILFIHLLNMTRCCLYCS